MSNDRTDIPKADLPEDQGLINPEGPSPRAGINPDHGIYARGAKYDSVREAYRAKDGFLSGVGEVIRNTGLGRTIRLKNKTGKIIAMVIAGFVSTFLPEPYGSWFWQLVNGLILTQIGVPMEIFDMSLVQIAITLIPLIAGLVVTYFFPTIKQHAVWKTIDGRLDDVADEVVKAIDKDSEGGKKITRNELKAIIGSALKKEDLK